MRRTLAVAEYVFKQSFRNKILNVLILFAVFAIGFSYFVSTLAQETEAKMVTDFGLFAIELFAFMTLALSVTIQLFEETELKTLSIIIVKPLKRYEYMAGKYIGILATVFMNITLMLITLMVIIKTVGGDVWDIRLIGAAYSVFVSTAILSAVALLLTVITTSVPTCIIYLMLIYALGHLTIHLKNIAHSFDSIAAKAAIDVVYYIVPNLELFNFKNRVFSKIYTVNPEFIIYILAYAALYSALSLSAAMVIFNRKEF